MRVHYTGHEGGIWKEAKLRMSLSQLIDRLDHIGLVYPSRCTQIAGFKRQWHRGLKKRANSIFWTGYLKGLELADGRKMDSRLQLFHSLRLSDNRIWDVVNGWRDKGNA